VSAETLLRFAVFAGLLAACMALEAVFPARNRVQPRLRRWALNLSLGGASVLVRRLLGPVTVAGAALYASSAGFGLFNLFKMPAALMAVLALMLLDLAMWTQHWAMHRVPLLSALHRIHHTDQDLDATSGLRFHPAEAAVSILWKCGAVMLLGVPASIALAYEIMLSATAIFTHSNLKLPAGFERTIRRVFVTPDMHRLHHSVRREERNSNYGNTLSVWDRIFRTYTDKAEGELVLGMNAPPVTAAP